MYLVINQDNKIGAMSLDDWNDYVDKIEARLADGELSDFETKHRFADGMYIREIFMPKGSMVISNTHNTKHPYVILQGKVSVRDHSGIQILEAPHQGITIPGTRRILHMEEDVRWVTFHATPLTSVPEIMDSILQKRTNPLLTPAQLLKIQNRVKQTNLLY